MARLYANENFPRAVVLALRELGHDVTTTVESGIAGQGTPDEKVLETAIGDDRVPPIKLEKCSAPVIEPALAIPLVNASPIPPPEPPESSGICTEVKP